MDQAGQGFRPHDQGYRPDEHTAEQPDADMATEGGADCLAAAGVQGCGGDVAAGGGAQGCGGDGAAAVGGVQGCGGPCFHCGKPGRLRVLWGRSY